MTAIRGNTGKPAVVFIHGLGMDKSIWESPEESRILGGRLPLSLLLTKEPEPETVKDVSKHNEVSTGFLLGDTPHNLTTLFHKLRDHGYTVIVWSQQRPAAETAIAVSELRAVLAKHDLYCRSGIILVGHSRGGLVARRYLKEGDSRVRALITLATPHKGSGMARWVKYMAPLASVINPLLSASEKGTLKNTMKRIFDFLESAAVKELLPESPLFQTLEDSRVAGVYYLSFGGNSPTLFSLYRRVLDRVQYGDTERCILKARRVFSLPDVFETIIPEGLYPDEMKRGRGDGLVSVESSRIPWADDHFVFDVNHAGILFDERVKDKVVEILGDME
ncbi:MAG TPA: alpha/beta fold hydrolase [Thermodesulfovibrionales bacterium]|nr:alpha/beta fold hydrolase [Thermodesulfovibrionales bacterium]